METNINPIKKKETKPRCPKGTKRNKKTGNCDPIKKDLTNSTQKSTQKSTLKTNKSTGEKVKVKLVIEESTPDIDVDVGVSEPLTDSKQNEIKNKIELMERDSLIKEPNALPYLYPNLNDPNFNVNISSRKEFYETRYDGEIKDVISESELMCNADFELAPHQLFVRNFLSFQTPYNSLLLYHGLGSGKTCSAISIAEEMRDYLIQMNITNRIIVVASPNVQENFKLQLFDERKLQNIDGIWNIRSCTGNKFLKEINPMNMKGLTKENIVSQIKRLINNYYVFLGYTEFSNYIQKKSAIGDEIKDPKKRNSMIRNKLKYQFSNRLIIIDEVHNIRISDDNKPGKKKVAQELFKLVKYADNLRLLLLSATPMYNSYSEIIWLVNLMNLNDRRSTIEVKDVFNGNGSFKLSKDGKPVGKELLERKATGYISYVRGENPYTFPYKLWPEEFSPENTFNTHLKPLVQLNGKNIIQGIEFISLYLTKIGDYQQKGYEYIKDSIKTKQGLNFENLDAFGYTILQKPIEALNMIYPDKRLELSESIDVMDLVGSAGLKRMMTFTETISPPGRYDFEYKKNEYGRIFSPNEIGKYSGKIKQICERILHSTGVVLVYSNYIDGGILPIAIALEELGFTRAGNVRSLFKTPPTEKIDAITFKTKKELEATQSFNPAKYVMITGDEGLSPDNLKDINASTDIKNKNGEKVKVVLISLAGSEGLDLKYIRQVHILDPWYNMNRIEQIIGRAVRTCSHKDLPFVKRNVEIYLYGTLLENEREESVDLYVYRIAEIKAIQIGNVSRVIKEIAVDCILNHGQTNFTVENMNQMVEIELSSGGTLDYNIGDKPYSQICDYMKKCSYTCKPSKDITEDEINNDTYNESFTIVNNEKIIYKIKMLMKDRFFYRKPLLVSMINDVKEYSQIQINAALNQLIEDKNEYITDKYGRIGNLINIGDMYLFQPLELSNEHIGLYERSTPVEFKHETIDINMEPSNGKEGSNVNVKEVSNKVRVPSTSVPKLNEKATTLFDKMFEKYTLAITESKPKRGDDNWYKFCSAVIDEMETLSISKDILLDAIVEHICDDLEFEDKMIILNSLDDIDKNDFILKVEKYLLKNVLVNKGIKGLFIQNKGTQHLYIKKGNVWVLSESEDIYDLEKEIAILKDNFLPVTDKLNNIVGFMSNFKKEDKNIVFKLKVFKLNGVIKRRNKGSRCYGKSIELMTEILGKDIYTLYLDLIQVKYKDIIEEKKLNRELNNDFDVIPNELDAINHIHACVIQEMFLRVYNREKKDGKVWFLTPEESLLVDIENLSL